MRSTSFGLELDLARGALADALVVTIARGRG